jgi:hypothetical protein
VKGCLVYRLLSGVDGPRFRHAKLSFWFAKVIVRHTDFLIFRWLCAYFVSRRVSIRIKYIGVCVYRKLFCMCFSASVWALGGFLWYNLCVPRYRETLKYVSESDRVLLVLCGYVVGHVVGCWGSEYVGVDGRKGGGTYFVSSCTYMGLRVSANISFICCYCLLRSYMWNRSIVFSSWPFFFIWSTSNVSLIVPYLCSVFYYVSGVHGILSVCFYGLNVSPVFPINFHRKQLSVICSFGFRWFSFVLEVLKDIFYVCIL